MNQVGNTPEARPTSSPRFRMLRPPYRELETLRRVDVGVVGGPGTAVIWDLSTGIDVGGLRAAEERRPGVALMVMLPPAEDIQSTTPLFEVVETCRPHSIIPHHPRHSVEEWTRLLQRFPVDLGSEVVDYLTWSGIRIDRETRRIVRRTIELSADLRTVSGLARALYVSRRALGRRFMKRGLPAPSHWLHFGRVLRACLRLQASPENLFTVACSLGYSDGFALSNQMYRLTGVRPSMTRGHFGWEWLVEQWLDREDTRALSRVALNRETEDDATAAAAASSTPSPTPSPTSLSVSPTRTSRAAHPPNRVTAPSGATGSIPVAP